MFTKNIVAFAAVAAMAEQALAFNSHRHLHQEVEKRAEETCFTTVYQTVTVTAGKEAAPTVVTSVTVEAAPAKPTSVKEEAPAPKPTTLATLVKPAPTAVESSIAAVLNPVKPTSTKVSAPVESSTVKASAANPAFNKRGLAYNDVGMANAFSSACTNCGWAYNWGSSRGDLDQKLNFVPMLWGDREDFTTPWDANAETALSQGSQALFSFNEPDHGEQAAMQPAAAAAAHAKYMNKYAGRALIGAPAVTNSGSDNEGLSWLSNFIGACDAQDGGCAIDFCNVHWYSEYEWRNTLFEHLEKAHDICGGKPIWLTEFAPVSSDGQRDDFMRDIIPQLDALDYLHAYSYFMVTSDNGLMSGPTSLTSFGQLYATL